MVIRMAEFTNFVDMFAQSIGLKDPWSIERAEFDEETREVHVYVKARKTASYPCPKCGKQCKRYDDEETERVWRHGDVVFFPCYIHCRRPRIKCGDEIHVVSAPWARAGCRYTLLFESYAMLLMQSMPINQARKLLRVSHTSLRAILKYWVNKAVSEEDLSALRCVCVDETSFKKGQSYATIVSDGELKRVIDVEEGRDATTIEKFSIKLVEKGGDSDKIRQYISDMSPAYELARNICFPKATQIIDKFHVKQLLLQAMDEVRRTEQGKSFSKNKKAGKKLLMIPESRLTENQQKRVKELSKQFPKTGRAYRMVQVLDEMYKCSRPADAEAIFNRLISWLKRSRLEPMKKVAESLKQRKSTILAYFRYRITNAIAEGINSLIQAAKRKARGFKTFDGFASMIYLVVGKLKLDCPPLFV